MRRLVLAFVLVAAAATPGRALIPTHNSVGFVSFVLDEGTEIIRADSHQVTLLRWTPERLARRTEHDVALAWQDLLTRIHQDWRIAVSGCWFCAPGGWPMLNVPCVEAARQAVQARVAEVYQPAYWLRVEGTLDRIPTLWWQSPQPGGGAVIACVAGASSPIYQSLLPDPYFYQRPQPPDPPRKLSAEPPGDPQKEALKEATLSGRPARVDGYQQVGYVVFLRTMGAIASHTFTAPVVGTCVQCALVWCWPVTRTWTVTLPVTLQRAITDWPAVAEGYGIPGIR